MNSMGENFQRAEPESLFNNKRNKRHSISGKLQMDSVVNREKRLSWLNNKLQKEKD